MTAMRGSPPSVAASVSRFIALYRSGLTSYFRYWNQVSSGPSPRGGFRAKLRVGCGGMGWDISRQCAPAYARNRKWPIWPTLFLSALLFIRLSRCKIILNMGPHQDDGLATAHPEKNIPTVFSPIYLQFAHSQFSKNTYGERGQLKHGVRWNMALFSRICNRWHCQHHCECAFDHFICQRSLGGGRTVSLIWHLFLCF